MLVPSMLLNQQAALPPPPFTLPTFSGFSEFLPFDDISNGV